MESAVAFSIPLHEMFSQQKRIDTPLSKFHEAVLLQAPQAHPRGSTIIKGKTLMGGLVLDND